MAALLFNPGPASRPRLCLFSDATLPVARTIKFCVRLSIKVASESRKPFALSVRRASVFIQVPTNLPAGGAAAWQTSLLLRDLPLKERFTVVDTASIPAPTPLRNPIRARAEKCLLTVRAREKSASCRWVLTEKMFEL